MIISLPGAKVLGEEEVESEEGLPRDTGVMVLEAMLDDAPEANHKMKDFYHGNSLGTGFG